MVEVIHYSKNDENARNTSSQVFNELYPDPKSLPTPPALSELEDTRRKLYGRNVHARGSIMYVHDELWFFPNEIRIS